MTCLRCVTPIKCANSGLGCSPGTWPAEKPADLVPPELKRYDFDWGYVGIEQREDELGEWVRYRDALAFYSKELDRAYAEGRKDEAQERGDGPIQKGWQTSVTVGHSGYGVYAHMEEYSEEGAILLHEIKRSRE